MNPVKILSTNWGIVPCLVAFLVVMSGARSHDRTTEDGQLRIDQAAELSAEELAGLVHRWARVEQVKRGILTQLGLAEAPRNGNRTETEDQRIASDHAMFIYRRSLQQIDGSSLRQEDELVRESDDEIGSKRAKKFYSFSTKSGIHQDVIQRVNTWNGNKFNNRNAKCFCDVFSSF